MPMTSAVMQLRQGSARQRHRLATLDFANSLPAVTRCARCSQFFQGTVGEGKAWFRAHRKRCK